MLQITTEDKGLGVKGFTVEHEDGEPTGLIGTANDQGANGVTWELYDLGSMEAVDTGRSARLAWKAAVRTAAVNHLGRVAT